MVNILKSFNLKELNEWEAAKNCLVSIVKRLRQDQGIVEADGRLFEEFEKSEIFGLDAIRSAINSQDSDKSNDTNQVIDFYAKICADVRASLKASDEDPELQRLSELWKHHPENLQYCYDLANRAAQLQKYELALELLLAIISKDKSWQQGIAIARIKSLFNEIGPGKPYVLKARKELSFWLH